jgi:Metallo-peptidase family M12
VHVIVLILLCADSDSKPITENLSMRSTSLLAIAAASALNLSALAAPHAHAFTAESSQVALTSAQSFQQIRIGDIVELAVTLQDGQSVELELERFSPFTPGARIVSVDAKGIEHAIDLSSDVHLRGHLADDDSQIAYIAVTQFGTSGYLEIANNSFVISTGKYDGQAKTVADLAITPSDQLGLEPFGQSCAVDMNNPTFAPSGRLPSQDFTGTGDIFIPLGGTPQRDAKVALETDYEFTNSLFGGNTTASASYASTLLAAISTIYNRDVNMTLSVPFLRTYASNNDPYGGSDIIDFLEDVQSEFNSGDEANIDRAVVQGLSARSLGGGVAWLATACSDFWGIGVSANLDGFFPNPLQDNSHNNWDVIVAAHEMGHNFGTGHTHDDYNPVIDGCGNGDCSQRLNATIMSYCHLCTGGLSNIDLRFHERVQTRILSYLQNDADCDLTVELCQADLLADGSLNFLDISFFLTAFGNEDSVADWDDNGTFNFLDISAYLATYAQGCP